MSSEKVIIIEINHRSGEREKKKKKKSFSGSPSKENACRILTKENIILNAIKMLEMKLKIIGNDIKAEINEGWGNIRLRMTLKINVRWLSLALETPDIYF